MCDYGQSVTRFSLEMAQRLNANSHKQGWGNAGPRWLLRRLRSEVTELAKAMKEQNRDEVIEEAADVANFAMMISERARQQADMTQDSYAWIER